MDIALHVAISIFRYKIHSDIKASNQIFSRTSVTSYK